METWNKLVTFSGLDVLDALSTTLYHGVLQNLKTKKMLANIVQYARYDNLTIKTTNRKIFHKVWKDLEQALITKLSK